MKKNNLYVDIHVLQNIPPSCVNRDDTGSPKTAKYGGVMRARVSSQSWKHEMRKMFKEMGDKIDVGIRTKRVTDMIVEEIKKLSDIDDEKAEKLALAALEKASIKVNAKKNNVSPVLMFFSTKQAKAFARLAVDKCKEKKKYKEALNVQPSADMVLFGRMVANDSSLNFDAAAQVAHAISTHAVHNEYDFFTAVDDLNTDEESGAGHMGTIEFNSSTLYRYATVNVKELQRNLNDTAGEVVRCFVEAFIKTMPDGKKNSFANKTMPDYVYITLREDQPINLVGAFEEPIVSNEGYVKKSIKRLEEYCEEIYKKYDCMPLKTWKIGEQSITQILEELETAVKEILTESESD